MPMFPNCVHYCSLMPKIGIFRCNLWGARSSDVITSYTMSIKVGVLPPTRISVKHVIDRYRTSSGNHNLKPNHFDSGDS